MHDDGQFICMAFDLFGTAMEHGNQPFSALVGKGGEIITQAQSNKITRQDWSLHSELTMASRSAMFLNEQEM